MSKVVEMFNEKVKLVSENEFTKHHRYEEKEIDCYLSKAYDEETDKHFLVVSIPKIAELNAMHIQYPMVFDTENERDEFFKNFNPLDFLDFLLDQMKNQIEAAKAAESENATKTEETFTLQEIAEMSDDCIQVITEEEAEKLDLPELKEHIEKPE